MLTIERSRSALLLIDFQARLMPAIVEGEAVIGNARRLLDTAQLLEIPVFLTEQNAKGLGATVPELLSGTDARPFHKTSFDACRMAGFLEQLPDRPDLVVAGCETHVCVLQTALGLIEAGRHVIFGARRGRLAPRREQGDGDSPA